MCDANACVAFHSNMTPPIGTASPTAVEIATGSLFASCITFRVLSSRSVSQHLSYAVFSVISSATSLPTVNFVTHFSCGVYLCQTVELSFTVAFGLWPFVSVLTVSSFIYYFVLTRFMQHRVIKPTMKETLREC